MSAPRLAGTVPEQVSSAFAEVIAEGIDAAVEAVNVHSTCPEFNVIIRNPHEGRIGGHGAGLIHEEVVRLVAIAERNGARLWLQFGESLCLCWPGNDPAGPIGQDGPAAVERRLVRDGAGANA